MSEHSAIEWTDATWNPVTGCSKVSPGCAHCYAENLSLRWGRSLAPWTPANAARNVVLHPDRLRLPLGWRKPRRIFVNSMSDLFHEQVPDSFIFEVFLIMAQSQQHIFQVLTKRPERMRDLLTKWTDDTAVRCQFAASGWPLPNVWLGTSVENQRWATERIPALIAAPATIRFLSCEPLLGLLDLAAWLPRLHWVISGGESGPSHRPIDSDWVRTIRDQCVAAGVAFFHKQWGGRTPKSGGRLLDGRTWDEFPLDLTATNQIRHKMA